ncbi:MAG: hypothetical protein ABJA93_12490 [Sporichthyaceae bacterium]
MADFPFNMPVTLGPAFASLLLASGPAVSGLNDGLVVLASVLGEIEVGPWTAAPALFFAP